ncbi:MAG: MarR family transcriptional regulator [Solirubrobacteraceae bacterium]|nr:MarR family transcriptional regulator [Solirubrobacteraceae bacterium]
MQRTFVTPEQLAAQLTDFLETSFTTTRDPGLELAAELDLGLTQLRALLTLAASSAAPSLHELADEIGLSIAATGRMVDGLVRHDLAARAEDPADRRVKRISLTPAGLQVMDRLRAARVDALTQFASTFTDAERETLAEALAPVLTRLADPPEHHG